MLSRASLSAAGTYIAHVLQWRWQTLWRSSISVEISNLGYKEPLLQPATDVATGLQGPWNFDLYDGYERAPHLRITMSF